MIHISGKTVLISVVILISVGFLWSIVNFSQHKVSSDKSSAKTDEIFWTGRILSIGGSAAYAELSDFVINNKISIRKSHDLAHAFGAALYSTESEGGFPVCDSRFLYGCFHEFIGRAISEEGLLATEKLNFKCVDSLGDESHFCQHGVGHGIQAYFGYEEEDLDSALKSCGELPLNDPIGGCRGGIFMEYNFRTMLADDADLRSDDNPYSVCKNLTNDDLLACSYWVPQWWYESLHEKLSNQMTKMEIFKRIGYNCTEMHQDNEQLLTTCFRGIGNVAAPVSDYSLPLSSALCESASFDQKLVQECNFTSSQFFENN
jgi:hypothetical protein